jgi:hypothetical protein
MKRSPAVTTSPVPGCDRLVEGVANAYTLGADLFVFLTPRPRRAAAYAYHPFRQCRQVASGIAEQNGGHQYCGFGRAFLRPIRLAFA